jgi:hypothetical protein
MLKLTLTVEGDTTEDLTLALEEITSKLDQGFTSGLDGNDSVHYNFDVTGKEAPGIS